MRHDVLVARVVVVVAFALASCSTNESDQKNGSSLSSLEMYTIDDDSQKNRCEGEKTASSDMLFELVEYPDGKKSSLQAVTENALRAIPSGVQEFFKNDLKGKIILSKDAKTICKDDRPRQKLKVQEVEVEACYTIENPTADEPKLSVVILADADAIAHNTVKVFGFLVAQLYSRYKPSLKFATAKMALSRTYLMDVVNSEVFTATEIDLLLGPGIHGKVSDNLKGEGTDVLDDITFDPNGDGLGTIKSDRRVFEEEIFAEAFDSYYCNSKAEYDSGTGAELAALRRKDMDKRDELLRSAKNTRRLMQDIFPGTATIFKQIDLLLSKVALPALSLTETSAAAAELSLTDEARKELCQQFPDADECQDDEADDEADDKDDKDEPEAPKTPDDERLKDELCQLFPWAEGCDDIKKDKDDDDKSPSKDKKNLSELLNKLKPIVINIIIQLDRNSKPRYLKGGRCGRYYRAYGPRRW